ncbi:hypothetical protein BKP43_07900 [Variovorax boronicumulans]|uniref:hypothetical protein n=1 Tax=Variovorax boronicumulans TaxID=436515 RepID=UPI00117F34C1|nr:hypothetical protein [Variovorax boronicumulans]PBI94990.1 hypothetical protein BKP43_07900 [Variovorax boronicumulans]
MSRKFTTAAAVSMTMALAACGGGGGGSGGGGLGLFPPPSSSASATAPTIKVNNATVQGEGPHTVKPGDTVQIDAGTAVEWTSTGEKITLRSPEIGASSWKAQLVNGSTQAKPFKVTARAANNAWDINFEVAGGDARNGSYSAFATNGTRQTVALNFDVGTYEWTGSNITAVSGSFTADADQAGTYLFQSSRITTAANTARFRVGQDVLVGAFPFDVTQAATESFATQSFVASRALETNQAGLDGTFNRFGINVGSATSVSDISQMKISGGGTVLVRCTHSTIYRVDNCPAASLKTWNISPGTVVGTWNMVDPAAPADAALFAMARVGSEKIFLISGKLNGDPKTAVFRIGLPESSQWPTGFGYGISTAASWGKVDVRATESFRSAVSTDGSTSSAHNTFGTMGSLGPLGMRGIVGTGTDPKSYFAMQGSSIFAIVGANNATTGTNGYLQINLMD